MSEKEKMVGGLWKLYSIIKTSYPTGELVSLSEDEFLFLMESLKAPRLDEAPKINEENWRRNTAP